MATPASSYDEVPYESVAYAQTHPDRLATVATLFGLKPPRVDACRVLELGCASGGNLIPMAQALPGSRFVGVDLSAREIADGQQCLDVLGLRNVELRALSITDIDESFGQFDYIICHGVFSWVPRDVQERIFTLCARQLAPHGVVYISYNTYPGWHMRGMIRDMMRFHAERFDTASRRVQQARALLDFLAGSVTKKDGPYGLMLKQELDLLRKTGDSYLLHEHLEDVNEPFYFHEFVRRAGVHRLRYLGEADVHAMAAHSFPAEVQATLRRLSANLIQSEQYLDFLRHRMFRQTLLVHEEAPISHGVPVERIRDFHIASDVQPSDSAEDSDLRSDEEKEFRGADGLTLRTRHPLFKAAVHHLGKKWPRAVPFAELREAARARLGGGAANPAAIESDTRELGTRLLRCYTASKLIELHVHLPPFATTASECPVASPFARWQSAHRARVTNLRHENVTLTDTERNVFPALDGTRDRIALAALIAPGSPSAAQRGATDTLLAHLASQALLLP
jgi:SAM-dependent methyltransferase/methyltransferase-like protein